jgi:hypothetical protein
LFIRVGFDRYFLLQLARFVREVDGRHQFVTFTWLQRPRQSGRADPGATAGHAYGHNRYRTRAAIGRRECNFGELSFLINHRSLFAIIPSQ